MQQGIHEGFCVEYFLNQFVEFTWITADLCTPNVSGTGVAKSLLSKNTLSSAKAVPFGTNLGPIQPRGSQFSSFTTLLSLQAEGLAPCWCSTDPHSPLCYQPCQRESQLPISAHKSNITPGPCMTIRMLVSVPFGADGAPETHCTLLLLSVLPVGDTP